MKNYNNEEKAVIKSLKESFEINKGIDEKLDDAFRKILEYYMEPYEFSTYMKKT